MSKTNPGRFFEDFTLGETLLHATPRTLSEGDQALYTALYGSRFALSSSDAFAQDMGYPAAPLDDLLVFHVVFGKTVPDVSLNAIANLGYARGRFLKAVYPGDTLATTSRVVGLKENSNRQTGVVYVQSTGRDQTGAEVLDYLRWVMVRKRDPQSTAPAPVVPDLKAFDPKEELTLPEGDFSAYDFDLAGARHAWEDYEVGEKIDHVDGMTIEEAEHQLATRLYQNTAKVHFNLHQEKDGRNGRRIVYGGHIISLVRALSFNGLENAQRIVAINGGTHAAPAFAGDTIYAWSQVLDTWAAPGRDDIGFLRLRSVGLKDKTAQDFPLKDTDGKYAPGVILDFDYTLVLPRRR